MKYKDLMSFEPIEEVVQLMDADKEPNARQLVKTYVISEAMADRMTALIFPQLQFDQPRDNKGLLIVGNYGTGKSHLMSVISALAENREMLEFLTNQDIFQPENDENEDRFYADQIAGKFKVLRVEIGAVTTRLREIITTELEDYLKKIDIDFSFPPMDSITNNKDAFQDMMAEFHQKYPDQGLLLVVDELLDYLKTRKSQDIILDLNFMRELGEICKNLRFRFMAGVQEALFNNPRFEFIAEKLQWVLARYDEIFIEKSDIKFVVKERLLKKTADQEDQIRQHLSPFTRFYERMNERLEEFVQMFPVHPDFVDTFEQVTMIEKREVLKTISKQMRSLLHQEVPEDYPGLIAFDSYWDEISSNASYKAQPNVNEVIECSNVLLDRVQEAYTRPQSKPMALRVVKALSVHRLTTGGDIRTPIGPTANELQTKLCLFDPLIKEMGSDEPEKDLLTLVKTVLKEIIKTVNGQFISKNEENEQYYLDLDKTEDFDAKIEEKVEVLSNDELDRYYYIALRNAMEQPDNTYITGQNIWEYELEWPEKNTGRSGYLFFGTPNERATAIPPQDFYIYFLQPFEPPRFKDEKKADEVFVKLRNFNEGFTTPLKFFAAARELQAPASGNAKRVYASKAEQYLHELVHWMQAHIFEGFDITYQGSTKMLQSRLKPDAFSRFQQNRAQGAINFKEIMDAVTSGCLSAHFSDQAPGYPSFSIMIRRNTRDEAAKNAIRQIAGLHSTKQGTAVLDALELLDGDRITTDSSRYVKTIQDLLDAKPQGQVCNHNEILIQQNGLTFMDPGGQRLEPAWVVVVLAAMVYSGDIVLAIPGKKYDATSLKELSGRPLEELQQFKHIERPKDWNVPGLKALFELLNLPVGLVNVLIQRDPEAVQQLQVAVNQTLERTITAQQILRKGLTFWNQSLDDPSVQQVKIDRASELKEFLDSLGRFNTLGKLKNFSLKAEEIRTHQPNMSLVQDLILLKDMLDDLSGLVNWLTQAVAYIPPQDSWVESLSATKGDVLDFIRSTEVEDLHDEIGTYQVRMENLKEEYIQAYLENHRKARLNATSDQRKAQLIADDRLKILDQLKVINLLPEQELLDLKETLGGLRSCFELRESELQQNPLCPHCEYKPNMEQASVSAEHRLSQVDDEMDRMLDNWRQTLLNTLKDPTIQQDLNLLDPDKKAQLQAFQENEEFPVPLDRYFVAALQEVLSGLEKVPLHINRVRQALRGESGAATPVEIKQRFSNLVDSLMQGKDPNKVRFVIEKEADEEENQRTLQ